MKFALSKVDLQDVLAVWRRNLLVYRRLWKTELVAPIIEPIFTFFAFGFGVGSLVASTVEGLSYLSFVGAGVLAFTVLMRSLFELTYGAYFRMVYQSTYDAILATPVSVESLALGEILWGVTKAAIDCVFILIIVAAFGAASSLLAPLAFVPLMLGSLFLSGLALGTTAKIFEIDHFNIFFAAFFSIIFVTGAWFPIEMLPAWMQVLAYVLPITAAIDLARACLNNAFATRHIFEFVYLTMVAFVFTEWALRSLRRRMVV
ncbi:MAG: ABC transporter permease [Acidobacteriota bacterium]|nr:ABC transporter permease [Acidobacteriota bacterium]